MLHQIAVRNFQSLHAVDVALAPFTVIVGPSSVGKSAFTRALRLLVSNARGHAFISHGERIATVAARTDKGSISIQRGPATADNRYTVIPAGDPTAKREYSKLSGTVPEEVSDFLGVQPSDPINFAGQFDPPYLLAAPGATAAKILGDLTNVAIIFRGAQEANRQKLAAGALLNTRRTDLEGVTAAREQFQGLPEQLAALDAAEERIDGARRIAFQHARLTSTVTTLRQANQDIATCRPIAERVIPSEQPLVEAYNAVQRLQGVIRELRAATEAYHVQTQALAEAQATVAELEGRYAETLHAAGQCPTCGQTTERIHA